MQGWFWPDETLTGTNEVNRSASLTKCSSAS